MPVLETTQRRTQRPSPHNRSARAPVGVIVNPHSHANTRRTSGPHGKGAAYVARDVHLASPESKADLPGILADFARREVAAVAIDGGDGTLRDVLTQLVPVYGEAQPSIAILASGKTNLAARDIGGFDGGAEGLERLLRGLAGEAGLTQSERQALDITWPDASRRPLRGMLFGTAAFTQATALANESLHPRGVHHRAAVGLAVAGFLGRTLLGPRRAKLMAGEPMGVRIDDGEARGGDHFLVLVTPLHGLMLGLWPFAERGEGALHWLDVAAPPHRLLRLTAAAWRGVSPDWLEDYGHASGRAREIALDLAHPFVVDGDTFDPGEKGIRLSASPPIHFLAP